MPGPQVATPADAPPLNWRDGLPLLVTPRVVLRELRRSDAAALWAVARSPAVARHAWPPPATVDAFDTFITSAWRDRAAGRYACFAAVPRERTEPAGLLELRSLQPAFFRAELSLLADPILWEDGAFEDALRLVCGFAFETVGVRRIEIRVPASHERCNASLGALGVTREAVLRSAFAYAGGFEDQYLWAILAGVDALNGAS